MCGIAGLLLATGSAELGALTQAMTDTLLHRGPDGDGLWLDAEAGVGLGHRRLAIVDLSAAGAQPMRSADGRWIAVYNGELYNTEDLRAAIEGAGHRVAWRGHSDTEVMLEAVTLWGVVEATEKFNGIFAVALWDRRERRLWLIRDRLGVKPLYWGRLKDGGVAFCSELRALRALPGFNPQLDMVSVAGYLRSACIAAPRTIYRNAWKLPPAHIMSIAAGGEPGLTCYWSLREVAVRGQSNLDHRGDAEVTDELEALLGDAVGRQMVADVPLGAFLSGGIDSSAVVALMQKQSMRPVKTFSIGYAEAAYNEAPHARAVAKHLGTDHTELIFAPSDAQAVVGQLAAMFDEPFADSSQIPTFVVSELARRQVTVALSGDGGDECYAGYSRYHWVDRLSRLTASVPSPLLRAAGGAMRLLSIESWERLTQALPPRYRIGYAGDKIQKAAGIVTLGSVEAMYRGMIAQWPEPRDAMPGAVEPDGVWDEAGIAQALPEPIARQRYFDMMHYLPDDVLAKVDRASMAVSLEARVPLLDHRVVEYVWRLPRSQLGSRRDSKRILRRILYRHVPRELIERPKLGFNLPFGEWLRGPLADWAQDLLSERSLQDSGIFDSREIRQRFQDHLDGRRNWRSALWTVLMFQAWHRRWG